MKTPETPIYPSELSDVLVTEMYLQYLGRSPESKAIVEHHLRNHRTPESLLAEIKKSAEFQEKAATVAARNELTQLCYSQPEWVDVNVPDSTLREMFRRVQKQWEELGETDPYWSVISAPEFKTDSFESNRASFFASGKSSAELISHFSKRNDYKSGSGTLLELGCGVGRITVHLARMFSKVIAVDISPGNLVQCQANVARAGLDNVTTFLLRSPSQLLEIPSFDFLFSLIVLQHNPPPVAAFFLDNLLARVNVGGAALFQIPTHTPGYKFIASSYLASEYPSNGMEMHCIPMKNIYGMLEARGFSLQETLADGWTGWPGSHTFFAVKTRST